MVALYPALAYLYTYDGMTGQLSSERVRVPGGHRTNDSSPWPANVAAFARTQSAIVRTLDKDVPLLAEVIPVGEGDAVYFAERGEARRPASPASSDTDDESEDEDAPARRPRAVQQALQTVLDVELLARLLEEQLTCVEDLEDDAGSEQVVPEEGNDDGEQEDGNDGEEVVGAAVERALGQEGNANEERAVVCRTALQASWSTVHLKVERDDAGRNGAESFNRLVNGAFNDI
ncbi:hypothetical protein PYCCODRAFT_1274350 [Trametes coccinea BRFM310]|uniref:Uncharacterized protein n=1 Tax=Trametes coccinea (strain BRFM310) TaxID=1353009 RepID=A0A1Y2IV77_TRAC3|nr:hypothetical protein PYCCODRAFT_1274350 [Trametes coccinea BRFM310]